MHSFSIDHKEISIAPGTAPGCPVIYLNAAGGEGDAVRSILKKTDHLDFTLITICHLDWNRDLAPWDAPSVTKNAAPCSGGADAYLHLLTERILPQAERTLPAAPIWRGLAGYSLAGLFAVYALYQTDCFARAASISGSLWFPAFRAYALSHTLARRPDRFYASIGNRESKTRNPLLQTTRENTEAITAHLQAQGAETAFEVNPGTHYTDVAERIARGIRWILA